MKFCSSCGNRIPEGNDFCTICGTNSSSSQNCVDSNHKVAVKKQGICIISTLYFIVAGVILILSFAGGFKIMAGAEELSLLTSQAGNTIAEAYYNECGTVYGGFGLFVMAFGLFASGSIAFSGYKNMRK